MIRSPLPAHIARRAVGLATLLCAALLGVAAIVATAAGASAPPPLVASRTIDMRGFKFRPDSLRLAVGDTVIWSNADDEPHSVTLDTATFDSGDIAPGSRFRWVFRQKGRLRYHCEVHPRMKGVLDIR